MKTDILNLPHYHVLQVEDTDGDFHIRIETISSPECCIHCSSWALVGFGRRENWIRDLPIHGKRVGLSVDTRRFRCKSCGKTFYEHLPDMDSKRSMTVRLKTLLENRSLRHPFTHLADETGVSNTTIREVFDDYRKDLEGSLQFETPEVLGIDEIHLISRSRAVFTNIPSCFVIEMLPDRNKTSVVRYLSKLPYRERIRCVAIDMWQPYHEAVREVLPGIPVVVDNFHVVKMANAALNEVRKTVGGTLSPERRRSLMRSRPILLKRFADLNDVQRKRLDEWSREFPILAKAHQVKERFYDIYESPSRSEAGQRYKEWEADLDPELRDPFGSLLTAFQNWKEPILNYFDHQVTNACTESANNLIRAVQRMGRGYSFDVLRARILFIRHEAHRMKSFRRFGKRDLVAEEGMDYGLPSTNLENDEVSEGVDTAVLLELAEKGLV